MRPRLSFLVLSNFRSVLGEIRVPLDAPIVLIHGPNGSGKTSIITAIELALTGGVDCLRRVDEGYAKYLKHIDSDFGEVLLTMSNGHPNASPMRVTSAGFSAEPLLSGSDAHFFSERCNLAQSSLSRLLEIYQYTEKRDSDSALTKFVKELLGLDQLEALIEGLFAAGDLRRIRNLVPDFRAAEERHAEVETSLVSIGVTISELLNQESRLLGELKKAVDGTEATQQLFDSVHVELLRPRLLAEEEAAQLTVLARTLRELAAIKDEWNSLPTGAAEEERKVTDEYKETEAAVSRWRSGSGSVLEATIMSLRSKFPDIPSSGSTDPEFARSAALKAINQEISRCNREIEQDRNAAAEIKKIVDDIAGQRERVSALEAQISSAVRNSDALHQLLTALLPHIHGEDCPVCGRDYSEVSSQSLSAKLSTDILKLAGEARALEEAVNEKGRLEATISSLEGQAKALTIRQLKDEARSELLDRVSDLSEARSKLDGLAVEVRQAAEKLSTAARARTRLTEFSRREQRFTSIRQRLREIAQLIGVELNPSESPSNWIVDIERTLREQEVSLIQRQQSKELASDLLNKVLSVRAAVTREKQKLASAEAERDDLGNTLEVVRARRLLAKEVLEAAQRARVDVVRRVFNTSLNVIWRELFVRLAPYERFIPAFAVPDEQHLPLIAQLQTIERGGRPSGTPAIMLSAANLNVAALTLFLALNLAVEPKLDCVILDDPVQSMDEMHIAQFAALLRSLSREQQRQVIISVHEKPLFEYLRLELSPAYEGDKLITVELGQEQQDKTSAVCKTYDWSPERAVVSA